MIRNYPAYHLPARPEGERDNFKPATYDAAAAHIAGYLTLSVKNPRAGQLL